ncbi:hypothetical protein EF53_137 [Enterococcus phage 53]|nr:hypothetical protein EF53_137 [Enterococcus phage 53]
MINSFNFIFKFSPLFILQVNYTIVIVKSQ